MVDFESLYNKCGNPIITYRYNTYSSIVSYFEKLIKQFSFSNSSLELLGKSVLGKPVYGIKIGDQGPKILMWSQMHGNESTMTRALFLWLESLKENIVFEKYQLYIIPILNPDGNDQWIRNNANNVDLNRDAIHLSQPESLILKSVITDFKPDYAFNLHDQRTIYGDTDGANAMQLSFLAPASDLDRTITSARLNSMEIINEIFSCCQQYIEYSIGRYDDTYNPNCVGDQIATLGIPVVLFEAGHGGDDYNRDNSVIAMAHGLSAAFRFISLNLFTNNRSVVVESYHAIPGIANSFCDIYLLNVPSIESTRVNVAIMYKELINNNKIYYVPHITSINNASIKNGHRVIDLNSFDSFQLDFEIAANQIITSDLLDIHGFC